MGFVSWVLGPINRSIRFMDHFSIRRKIGLENNQNTRLKTGNFLRAQVSMEVIVILVALIVTFTVFMILYQNQATNLQQVQDRLQATDIAYKIANAINYVYLGGDGSSYSLAVIAPRLNITTTGNFVTAERSDTLFQAPLIVNVTNYTINNSGEIRIRNAGGNIVIN